MPGPFEQPRDAFLKEALAPLGDDLPWYVNPRRDRLVRQPLRSVEHDLRPDDISIQGILAIARPATSVLILKFHKNSRGTPANVLRFCIDM